MRVGIGHDTHRLVEGRPLILGGVRVEFERGLAGHSDADVVLHAVADALLGAAALGDIGTHFPSTDERWRGADSIDMLRAVDTMVRKAGYNVANIDVTVVAQRPRLAPKAEAIRARLAKALSLDISAVSIKATTSDGLGALGRAEGLAAMAIALLQPSPRAT